MNDLIDTENLRAVLEEYGTAVRNLYQDRLILHDRIASGELLNSIETHVEYDGQMWEVKMDLAEYWRYIEMDTKPHWPPPGVLLKWISYKIPYPRPLANGKLPTPEQLDYLIRRKIAVFGTKGIPDLTDSVQDMDRAYKERIEAALAKDMGNYLRKVFRTP